VCAAFAFLLAAGIAFAGSAPRPAAKSKVFVGYISDSMCGLKHMMPGKSDAECTLECVKAGAKYVLADRANSRVYDLSDQKTPEKFAGKKVRVRGTLKGTLIVLSSMEAAP
jgi:hypothetical protein